MPNHHALGQPVPIIPAPAQFVNHGSKEEGSIRDASKIYWDVRPSSHLETLEFRVADVCMSIDEAVMVAGLSRARGELGYEPAIQLRAGLERTVEYFRRAELTDAAHQPFAAYER